MKHPTDQELFSDFTREGLLEWSERKRGETTAETAYTDALRKWIKQQNGSINVRFTPIPGRKDPTKPDIIKHIDREMANVFGKGVEAAVQATEATGRIGNWPPDNILLAEMDGTTEEEKIPLEVNAREQLNKITLWDAYHLYSEGMEIMRGRKDARISRRATFFVLLHLLMLCYTAAMVLMPQLHLDSWVGEGIRNWIVIIASLAMFGIGWLLHKEDGWMNALNVGVIYFSYEFLRYVCNAPEYEHLHINALVAIGLTAFILIRYFIDGWAGYLIRFERKYIRDFESKYQHAYRKVRFVALWQGAVLGRETDAIEEANRNLQKARDYYEKIKKTRK